MSPEVDISDVPNRPGTYERFRVVAPITYKGHAAIDHELDDLKAAIQDLPVADVFMTATPPTGRRNDADVERFYPSPEAYMYAVADALHEEYKAITDAGFVLQLDLAATSARHPSAIEQRVEVVNYALRDIPEEMVRYHHCWGSMNHPHTMDVPLKDILHEMLKIKAQAYSIEAAPSTRARVDGVARRQAAGRKDSHPRHHLAPDKRRRASRIGCMANQELRQRGRQRQRDCGC
jgi:5-methyltetrahydropteroyltriglutamate--homocysteine methyltransferase